MLSSLNRIEAQYLIKITREVLRVKFDTLEHLAESVHVQNAQDDLSFVYSFACLF